MAIKMNWPKITLFLSGSFFCGAVSHLVFALTKSEVTDLNIPLGVTANWLFTVFDAAMTVLLYMVHRRLEKKWIRKMADNI